MVVGPVGRGHRAPYCPHVRRQADWELRVMLEILLLEAYDTGYSDLTHLPDLHAHDHCQLRKRNNDGFEVITAVTVMSTIFRDVITGVTSQKIELFRETASLETMNCDYPMR
jgi:hypothetical protein